MRVYARHLTGQCRSGADSSGVLIHAVQELTSTALCGRTYGRRSAGWSDHYDRAVTCPRCLRKMQLLGALIIQPEDAS